VVSEGDRWDYPHSFIPLNKFRKIEIIMAVEAADAFLARHFPNLKLETQTLKLR